MRTAVVAPGYGFGSTEERITGVAQDEAAYGLFTGDEGASSKSGTCSYRLDFRLARRWMGGAAAAFQKIFCWSIVPLAKSIALLLFALNIIERSAFICPPSKSREHRGPRHLEVLR
jgi:hypothetical protein